MTSRDYVRQSREGAPRPASFKEQIRNLVRNLTLSTISKLPSSKSGNYLRCLYCHYVFDDQKDKFRQILKSLKEIAVFIDTDRCIAMLQGSTPIDGRYFHLSFDDGFRNVFENAAPILKELEVPALIFVPTSLVGADWDATRRYCLETTLYPGVMQMISWDELITLKSQGFEIGSHTRSHARFTDLSTATLLKNELLGSKLDLETQLATECKYISWPYGAINDVNQTALRFVRQVGYRACFGAFRGTIIPGITDCYSIPRHHFEVEWPLSHIKYFANGNWEL